MSEHPRRRPDLSLIIAYLMVACIVAIMLGAAVQIWKEVLK